jgi:hypothetical protein
MMANCIKSLIFNIKIYYYWYQDFESKKGSKIKKPQKEQN